MDQKDLKAIIEQVLQEMNLGDSAASAAPAPASAPAAESVACTAQDSNIEDGCLPDVTEIDIRTQYLVENPEHGEEYMDIKKLAPCRLGIGKAGARYKTLPQLEFRAAHSAA